MQNQLKLRNAALVAALAAVTATAWATSEYATATPYSALDKHVVEAQGETVAAPAPAQSIVVTETLTANETVIVPDTSPIAPAPVAERSYVQPPLTIEDRRLTEDQRIQALVMDKLALAPNISGKIGVEAQDRVVTLTGYTATAGQAYRAGRHAGSVDGVKSVNNEIRPRIGGSV